MKTSLLTILAMLFAMSAFAQSHTPNQTCSGKNDFEEKVEVKLFVNKKIDDKYSEATLVVSLLGVAQEYKGKVTNEADSKKVKIFEHGEERLKFLSSGMLVDINDPRISVQMKCSKLEL